MSAFRGSRELRADGGGNGYRIRGAPFVISSTRPVANSPQSAENADRLSTAVHRRRVRLGKVRHRASGRLDRDFGGKLGADVAGLQLEPRARVEVDVRGHERDEGQRYRVDDPGDEVQNRERRV